MTKLCQLFPATEQVVSLESHLSRMALEGQFLANIIATFRSSLPDFVKNLRNINTDLFMRSNQPELAGLGLSRQNKVIVQNTKMLDFLTCGDTYIMVPENFKGNLNEYVIALNKVSNEVFLLQAQALEDYTQILSSFITNKQDKLSTKDHTAFFTRIREDREDQTKILAKFFTNNNNRTRLPLRSVMHRFADLEPLLKEVGELTSAQKKLSLNKVHANTTECADLLDIIIKSMSEGKMDHISPEAAANIANGAYEIAKYVEFTSVVYFKMSVMLSVVQQLMLDIEAITQNRARRSA